MRTRGGDLRRALVLRVVNSAILVSAFIVSCFLGSLWLPLILGVAVLSYIALTAIILVAYRRADPVFLASPVEPTPRMGLRYLRPNKYPYTGPPSRDWDDD
jgi:hypothetical protein